MRVLITGASGLAGGWLCRACVSAGDAVTGVSRSGSVPADAGAGVAVDLRDREAVEQVVGTAHPEVVYHLAALSSVGRSWQRPAQTLETNVLGAENVLSAVRAAAPDAHLVWVSSCEVYGSPAALPTSETAPLDPPNPYAVAKAAGEMLASVYARAHGMRITCLRPYSHAGPGQRPLFLLSNLARQAAQARLAGASQLSAVTGNPATRRDFTDVRDVVRAYRLVATLAPEPGEMPVYNVCSGRSISTAEQVKTIARLLAPIAVEQIVDPERVRASEVMELRGDHAKLTAATGWTAQISFEQTVADTIEWWQRRLTDDH